MTVHINSLIELLSDPDEEVRQEAAVEIALDFGKSASQAIPIFLNRLQSRVVTIHDRALAAWALPHIGADGDRVVPILLGVLDEVSTREEADQLRWCAAESIRKLTTDVGILVPLAQRCMRDAFWKCQMVGLFLAKGLIAEDASLRTRFVADAESLMGAEFDEIREEAQRIVSGS